MQLVGTDHYIRMDTRIVCICILSHLSFASCASFTTEAIGDIEDTYDYGYDEYYEDDNDDGDEYDEYYEYDNDEDNEYDVNYDSANDTEYVDFRTVKGDLIVAVDDNDTLTEIDLEARSKRISLDDKIIFVNPENVSENIEMTLRQINDIFDKKEYTKKTKLTRKEKKKARECRKNKLLTSASDGKCHWNQHPMARVKMPNG